MSRPRADLLDWSPLDAGALSTEEILAALYAANLLAVPGVHALPGGGSVRVKPTATGARLWINGRAVDVDFDGQPAPEEQV